EIVARYRAKVGWLVVTSALGVCVLAMGWAVQRTRARTLALQTDFVAAVSHELRTPLAGLRVMAETLERRLDGAPAARDYPARMVAEIDDLTFLVDNVLGFGRLKSGRLTPHIQATRLGDLLSRLKEDLARVTHVRVELSAQLDGVIVDADPELLLL